MAIFDKKAQSGQAKNTTFQHPDQRVGILIDVQNLYYSAKNLHNAKVNFKAVIDEAVGERKLIRSLAYVVTTGAAKDKEAFLTALEHSGIEIKSKQLQTYAGGMKKGDWDVGMAVDAIKLSKSMDAIILATGDGDFLPLAQYISQTSGSLVEAVAFRKSSSSALVEGVDAFLDLGSDEKKFLIND